MVRDIGRTHGGAVPESSSNRSEHGLLAQIPRIHLAVRLTYRLEQASLTDGTAKRGWLRAANVGGAIWDVASWAAIRSTEGSGLGWRLPVDLAELVFWEANTRRWSVNASALAIPLALESTARWGVAGLAVPVVDQLAMFVGHRIGGRPPKPVGLVFLAGVSIGGLAWGLVRDRRLERERLAHAAQLEARAAAAELAGENSVAMGADTVVDRLEAIAPVLRSETSDSGLHQLLAGWRASLAEHTSRHSVYLGVGLARWQRRHNLHPDLSTMVEFDLEEGAGTTLLSANQARALERALDRLGPAGRPRVTVESRQAGLSEPPGRPISLRIGEHRIELARDDDVRVNRFDPAPAILAAGALIALAPTQSVNEDVPLAWLAPFSAGFGLTAWWAHREIERRGAEASWEIVRASLVLCTTTSIVSTVMQRNPFMPSGEPNQPVVAEILPAIYLLRIHWRNLTPDQRRVAGSTLVGIVAACLALMPRPFRWTKVAVDLSWLVTNWVGVAGLGDALDTEAARLTEILSVGDEDAIDNAWQRGRRFVVELVEAAAADGRRLFVEREVSLPRETRQLIRRRLAQIDGRIAALKADAPT